MTDYSNNATRRDRREAVLREHMESENRHDFDATIGTFSHPRYELMADGRRYDGEAEVREYFKSWRAMSPDMHNENAVCFDDDAGIVCERVYWDTATIRRQVLGGEAS